MKRFLTFLCLVFVSLSLCSCASSPLEKYDRFLSKTRNGNFLDDLSEWVEESDKLLGTNFEAREAWAWVEEIDAYAQRVDYRDRSVVVFVRTDHDIVTSVGIIASYDSYVDSLDLPLRAKHFYGRPLYVEKQDKLLVGFDYLFESGSEWFVKKYQITWDISQSQNQPTIAFIKSEPIDGKWMSQLLIIPYAPEELGGESASTKSYSSIDMEDKDDTTEITGSLSTPSFWTDGGKSYHFSRDCVSLKRSKNILSGTLQDAINQGKKDPCNICAGGS